MAWESGPQWPTHRAKARTRKSVALAAKKRNRRKRKLLASGKRGGELQ